jgi:hypothetical protein
VRSSECGVSKDCEAAGGGAPRVWSRTSGAPSQLCRSEQGRGTWLSLLHSVQHRKRYLDYMKPSRYLRRQCLLAGVIVGALVAVVGCGGGDHSKSSTSEPSTVTTPSGPTTPSPANGGSHAGQQVPAPKPKRTTGTRSRATFEQARNACAASGVNQIAHTFHIRSRKVTEVARSYSRKAYDPPRRAEAFRGCLAGLK